MTEPDGSSNSNTGSGQAVTIRMVGTDKPLITALAIGLALAALFMAYMAEREARMAQYYISECILKEICPKGLNNGE